MASRYQGHYLVLLTITFPFLSFPFPSPSPFPFYQLIRSRLIAVGWIYWTISQYPSYSITHDVISYLLTPVSQPFLCFVFFYILFIYTLLFLDRLEKPDAMNDNGKWLICSGVTITLLYHTVIARILFSFLIVFY